MTSVRRREAAPVTLEPVGHELFERALALLMIGFVFLDRGFAWIHVPGTPLFITEMVLATGLVAALRGVVHSAVWTNTSVVSLLVAFVGWGLIRTLPDLFANVETALRDAANWIYILFTFAVLGTMIRGPLLLARWLRGYRRLAVPIVLGLPVVVVLSEQITGFTVPDSDVSFFSYKPGNAAVHLFLAIAFLWAVWRPDSVRAARWRYLVTAGGVAGILAISTQGRGGFVAATVAGGLLLLFTTERLRLMIAALGSVLAIAVTFLVIDPRLDVGGRDVSAEQFAENVSSIVTGEGEGELGGNVEWRLEHWGRVWEGVNREAPLIGHGFGVNIAALYQIPQADIGLRNAHNSHLTILSRMGWVGGAIWIAMWIFWFAETARAWRRHHELGLKYVAGLCAWAMSGVAAIHVNAIFDPTLEGPQVAVWLWVLTGLGMYATVLSRTRRFGPDGTAPAVTLETSLQRVLSSRRDRLARDMPNT